MAGTRELGERRNYVWDSDEGADREGYCLTPGDDGGAAVQKTTSASDKFVGVNHDSTYSKGYPAHDTRRSVEQGQMESVKREGVVNVLCEAGNVYDTFDEVFLSSTNGVANNSDSGSDTRVGTVDLNEGEGPIDLTDADEPQLVPVDITGHANQ